MRSISNPFLQEFLYGTIRQVLDYVRSDDSLDMELRGSEVMIYYRGGKILSIKEDGLEFSALDAKYHLGKILPSPTALNSQEYIPQAKRAVDMYVANIRNHLGEKDIQQLIARENNYSPNANDTDFFIIDIEYQEGKSRFDIVALRWDSTGSTRKLSGGYLPRITVFEVKQGYSAIAGKSGLVSHLADFEKFASDKTAVDAFKQDMIEVFEQKRRLGLIPSLDKNRNHVIQVEDEVDFVFLLANYKSKSTQLRTALFGVGDCRLIYANPMGYGLYSDNIIDKDQFIKMFL